MYLKYSNEMKIFHKIDEEWYKFPNFPKTLFKFTTYPTCRLNFRPNSDFQTLLDILTFYWHPHMTRVVYFWKHSYVFKATIEN